MSDTVKLVIEIDEEVWDWFVTKSYIPIMYYDSLADSMKNAVPLSEGLDENKGEWIPVTERLPEEHKEVLTCSLGGFIEIQSIELSIELNYWENQHGDLSDIDEVIAWMPLPEPYEAEKGGE